MCTYMYIYIYIYYLFILFTFTAVLLVKCKEMCLLVVLGEVLKVNMSRLLLCEAAANIMKAGFSILAINTVDRM